MTGPHYPQPTGRAPLLAVRRRLGTILVLVLLAGCASPGAERVRAGSPGAGAHRASYPQATAFSARSNQVLMRAIGLVGTPYRYGGNTPESGFDCSGLVDFVFMDAVGLALPRSTHELIEMDAPGIRRENLQPGDLLFFNPGGGKVSHIGIYVGESRFVHAPSGGGMVRLESMDTDYWNRYYAGAKRVLR